MGNKDTKEIDREVNVHAKMEWGCPDGSQTPLHCGPQVRLPSWEQGVSHHGVLSRGRALHAATEGEDVDGGYRHILLVPGAPCPGAPSPDWDYLQRPEAREHHAR